MKMSEDEIKYISKISEAFGLSFWESYLLVLICIKKMKIINI